MITDCLCSHPPHKGQCPYPLCGCGSYRPKPAVGDEAEAFLVAREARVTGETAPTGTEGAA
jgi:hypothetical protein